MSACFPRERSEVLWPAASEVPGAFGGRHERGNATTIEEAMLDANNALPYNAFAGVLCRVNVTDTTMQPEPDCGSLGHGRS